MTYLCLERSERNGEKHGIMGGKGAGADRYLFLCRQTACNGQGGKHGQEPYKQHNQSDAHIQKGRICVKSCKCGTIVAACG